MAIDNPRESSSSSSSSCGRNIYIMSNVQRAVSADASLDDGRTDRPVIPIFSPQTAGCDYTSALYSVSDF
jgi:hypothetical protein